MQATLVQIRRFRWVVTTSTRYYRAEVTCIAYWQVCRHPNCSARLNYHAPDWLAHVPKEVIAKNFQTDVSAFNNIPTGERYIFPARMS